MQREDSTFLPRKREANSVPHGKRPSKMACLSEIKTEPLNPVPSNSLEQSSPETPYTVTLTMPSKESMQHVLRCAYNEVTGLMTNKADHSQKYVAYAQKIEGLLGGFYGAMNWRHFFFQF